MTSDDHGRYQNAMNILLCGGIAGIVTWGSVFPLDMIKTRLQAQTLEPSRGTESQSLLRERQTLNSFQIAKETYHAEGIKAFYRGQAWSLQCQGIHRECRSGMFPSAIAIVSKLRSG